MNHTIEPVLHPVRIGDLRPTQLSVGMREVENKRKEWRQLRHEKAGPFLGTHMIPAVIGPHGRPWIIDHHHLVLALHLEGEEQVMVSVIAKLAHLPGKRFCAFLDSHNWLHPYDDKGKRQDWRDLPTHVAKLIDDPYRSLAGAVRHAGGYAKSPMPYAEFLWADFFRDRIRHKTIANNFEKTVEQCMELARSGSASYLPGWAGPQDG